LIGLCFSPNKLVTNKLVEVVLVTNKLVTNKLVEVVLVTNVFGRDLQLQFADIYFKIILALIVRADRLMV